MRRLIDSLKLTSNAILAPRRYVLLAPEVTKNSYFKRVSVDSKRHGMLLAGAQRLRGDAYFQMGAIEAAQLTSDGRQISEADDRSWHLLTLDERGQVAACLRYLAHPVSVSFPELAIARSALAKSEKWGRHVREAVAGEIDRAKLRGYSYVEIGGWAIAEALRCTTEALRMIVSAFALAQLSGGALGITTASLRSCSASVLRRIGGQELSVAGMRLPSFSDPQFKSTEVEILRFDSSNLNVRYKRWLEESMARLREVQVIHRSSEKRVCRRTQPRSARLCSVSC
jgi:hypothetical protein